MLSLAFLINPLHLSAQTAAAINGWELQEISRAGATSSYTAIKHTPNGSYISTAKITPNVANITKFVGRTGLLAIVGLAIKGLVGLVNYVMDPENNRVKITKNTGLWTDYHKEIVGNIATVGRYECAKPHGWGGGGGPIVRDYTYLGFAYVKCNNGYGFIRMHQEEETLTFDQLADQVFKNAQAGQPEAIAAIGEIADAQATLQWLATNWERNKKPLANTNANNQEKISPTAIALSQAHSSGKKRGGNCTPDEHDHLERKKHEYCDKNGQFTCKIAGLSKEELRERACVLRIALLCVPLLIPDVLQEGIKSIESKLDKHGKPMPVVLMKFQNSSDYHEK